MVKRALQAAYLIAICDRHTNGILGAAIWSSPEWEQSRCLPEVRTYVAFKLESASFQEASDAILGMIREERCRYHYLLEWLPERLTNPEPVDEAEKASR